MRNDNKFNSISEVIQSFIQERRDKKELSLLKDKPNKKNIGGINTKLEKLVKTNVKKDSEKKSQLEVLLKEKKSKDMSVLEFQKDKMRKLFSLATSLGLEGIEPIQDEFCKSVEKIDAEHVIATWLTDNCRNARGLSFASHVIKLTHSRISGASSIYDQSNQFNACYLTTSSMRSLILDSALDNAKFAPTATLLKLNHDGKSLSDYVLEGDSSPFATFSNNDELISEWMKELKQVFGSSRKSSHFLAKQIYFPLSSNPQYHLLLPVVSSSISHYIYLKVFDPDDKKAREQKKAGKYSSRSTVYYPNKAAIKVTASNHTNASELNGKRGGKLQLMPSLPPKWKKQIIIPKDKSSLFNNTINQNSKNSILKLQKLLLTIKSKELNRKDPKFHRQIVALINEIIEVIFDYVLSIQDMKDKAGWSAGSKLKEAHKLWLDPYREDENFQELRKDKSWLEEIKQDFALWLNKRLESKKLKMGKIQERFWVDLFSPRLREYLASTEDDQ